MELGSLAEDQFGDMIKAVVDVRRRVMVIGGELQSDEEAVLLGDGSEMQTIRQIVEALVTGEGE